MRVIPYNAGALPGLVGNCRDRTGTAKVCGRVGPAARVQSKAQVFDTALMSALSNQTFEEAEADREYWGHLVESAVGAIS